MADDARKMAAEIAELRQAVRDLQTSARIGYTAIDNGALVVKDEDGTVRQRIGRQPDGAFTVVDTNGITPPKPANPILIPGPISLTIASYGNTFGGQQWPYDFEAIEVHVSTSPGFTPSAATKVGEFTTGGGSQIVRGEPDVTLYVVLIGRNTSGTLGVPSDEISAAPEPVVTDEDLAEIEESVSGLTSRLDTTAEDIDNLNAAIEAGQFDVSGVRDAADAAQVDATAANTLAAAAEAAAANAQADVDVVEGRVTTVEGDVSSLTTRVTTAETDITAVEGRVTTAETDISSVESRVTTAEGSLSTHETRLDGAESNISTHETRLDTAETDITAVESRVTTTEGDISAVDTRVTTAEGTLSTHEGRIDSAEATITTHETRLDGAESDIDSVTTIAIGKSTNTYSTVAPTTQANSAGDLWFVVSGAQFTEVYRGLGGTSWEETVLADSTIGNLDAGKITSGFIAAARIATGTIIADMMAANSVTAAAIAAGAVEAGHLAAASVVAGNLAAGAVQAGNVAAGAIQTADLDALAVTADKLAANAVTVGKIAAGAVTAGSLAADAITGKTITGGTVTGATIIGGVLKTSETGSRVEVLPVAGSGEVHFYSDAAPDRHSVITGDGMNDASYCYESLQLAPGWPAGGTGGTDAGIYLQHHAPIGGGDMTGKIQLTATEVQVTSGPFGMSQMLEDTWWTNATLLNGWANYGAGYTVARYRRYNGIVYLEGLVASGSATIFVLPAGYRPFGGRLIFNPGGSSAGTRVDVDTGGNVIFMGGTNGFVSLAGISFIADA